jgi:hypothetical protein
MASHPSIPCTHLPDTVTREWRGDDCCMDADSAEAAARRRVFGWTRNDAAAQRHQPSLSTRPDRLRAFESVLGWVNCARAGVAGSGDGDGGPVVRPLCPAQFNGDAGSL